jgi:SAM-dependent methyltransferase
LFALSNAASLAALLGYPTLIEPFFGGRQTAMVWSIGYALFALLCIWVGLKSLRQASTSASNKTALAQNEETDAQHKGSYAQNNEANLQNNHSPSLYDANHRAIAQAASTPVRVALSWIVLSALGSAVLLAVTNHLTQNISSVPFLWVLPLALYLLSFIICFDRPSWYQRGVWGVAAAISLPLMVYFADSLALFQVSGFYAAGLFVVCMFCHGELASLKPHPSQLTRFYLAMSLGGALGALAIAIAAPLLLSGYYELHLTAAVIALVMFWRSLGTSWIWRIGSAGLVAGVAFLVHQELNEYRIGIREMERNFYGVVRTRDYPSEPGFRYMLHGSINHGGQLQGEPFEMMPATYYSPSSGYGRLFEAMPEGPKRVGLIGLGAGALAAYAQAGDQWVIYEINPVVVELAKKEFSFLQRMKAPYEIVLGDGRLALEREAPRQYDVLAVDAFSGDSIPIHLVTREAMAAYVKHLAPGGVIVFQATNRFVDLQPVAKRLADSFGLEAVLIEDSPEFTTGPERWYLHTDQIVMTKNKALLKHPAFKDAKAISLREDVGVFTDDHSNLLRILKH